MGRRAGRCAGASPTRSPVRRSPAVRRAGKVVLVDTDGPTIGLHFGMTGRLVVDGVAPIDRLQYASGRDDPQLGSARGVRPAVDGSGDQIQRPAPARPSQSRSRRLGTRCRLHVGDCRASAHGARRAQTRRSSRCCSTRRSSPGSGTCVSTRCSGGRGSTPRRPAETLDAADIEPLAHAIRRRLPIMLRRGGSHRGRCRRRCAPNVRRATATAVRCGETPIGGRTAVWCPMHQR